MFLNVESAKKWFSILTEELGIKDQNKLNWMSNLATVHELYEGLQSGASVDGGIYATPLNTLGMGNPSLPLGIGYNATSGAGIGNTGADFHNPAYKAGSGDSLPMSTLPIALNVAAMTIALELVPVIQANGPWHMLSYMDFPYAGGKLARFNETAMDGKGPGKDNKPIYVKISGDRAALRSIKDLVAKGTIKRYDDVAFACGTLASEKVSESGALYFVGKFMGFSRIDNNIIVEVSYCNDKIDASDGTTADYSIADVFDKYLADGKTGVDFIYGNLSAEYSSRTSVSLIGTSKNTAVRPDYVATMVDHLPEFANFFGGRDKDGNVVPTKDTMTRAQNETGVGNTLGARMFTKLVQMGSIEVTGAVTRQQLQDMPLYGVDVIGKVLEAMQNELSQHINRDILDRLFALGVTNAVEIFDAQGANLNLYVSAKDDAAPASVPAGYMIGIDGVDYAGVEGFTSNIANAHVKGAADNITTFQRRIMSRVLAASNLIAQVGRRGRANWIVCNTQIVSALQDAANFVVAPMVNTLVQDGSQSLYFAGSLAGMNIYVDPYMDWNDTRVLVGKKGDGNCPGVIFMPYILADQVQTVVEGTMAPKLLLNSRYAVVDAGFYPETSYYCFYVKCDDALV